MLELLSLLLGGGLRLVPEFLKVLSVALMAESVP